VLLLLAVERLLEAADGLGHAGQGVAEGVERLLELGFVGHGISWG
jgi:hypothetical protein